MTSTLEPLPTLGVSGTMSMLGTSGSMTTIQPSKKHAKQQVISLQLIDLDKFLVSGQISAFTQPTKDLLKRFSAEWDQEKKGWKCNLNFYKELSNQLKSLGIEVKGIPIMALDSITPMQDVLSIQKEDDNNLAVEIIYSQQEKNRKIERELPPKLLKNLYEFQKQGIQFGLRNYGRVLFADEMGVGKTIQAICLATCFRNAWPLIVICPSSLKYIWKEEILKWDGTLKENQIQIMMKHVSEVYLTSKVLICSYDIIPNIIDKIKRFNFNIAIADEAHYLKNLTAKRTQAIVPYLKRLRHVILLTGTPAFARPMEMFPLLQIVRPDVFKQLKPFGDRYCDPRPSKFRKGLEYQGSSNEKELHFILKKSLMIRRLKSEVLGQLPRKRRKKVLVNVDPKLLQEIQDILNRTSKSSLEQLFDFATKSIKGKDIIDNDLMRKNGSGSYFSALSLCYQLSGLAKIEELKNYIKDLLENEVKLIIFAHHQEMLNKLETFVSIDLKTKSIRIDGQVSARERYERVQQFQTDDSIRVAVLSLSAASTGLTLTASSNIVFAEMHWTPALMLQAEDRAHRIGQESSVLCHYIVGQQTLDDILYKKIEQKIAIVSNILDGQSRNLKMDLIRNEQGLEILENEVNSADEQEEEEQNNCEYDCQQEKDGLFQQDGIVLKDQIRNDLKQDNPIQIESKIKKNLSEDSDEDDNDLIEMMALKRIAEQEALKRKLQPQQTQLDWKNTEKNYEIKKKYENNNPNNPNNNNIPVKPSVKMLDEIFSKLKPMPSSTSVVPTQFRQDNQQANQKVPILQNLSIQSNTIQLEEQAKNPGVTGNLLQKPSNVCISSSMEIENQPPKHKTRDYVKEIEKAQEKCNNSKKTSCQSRLTTGFDFLDEALDERSDGEENKTQPEILDKNQSNTIVIGEDDNDIDLNVEEETFNNSKQLISANFVRERKVLKNGKIVEKQENGIYKITHRNGDSYFISDYEESKEEAEDEKDHSHPIQLNDFFNQKKFIPTKFSNYSSASKLTANKQQVVSQQSTGGGIRFRKSFMEDSGVVLHNLDQDDQINKKLKKPSYFQ